MVGFFRCAFWTKFLRPLPAQSPTTSPWTPTPTPSRCTLTCPLTRWTLSAALRTVKFSIPLTTPSSWPAPTSTSRPWWRMPSTIPCPALLKWPPCPFHAAKVPWPRRTTGTRIAEAAERTGGSFVRWPATRDSFLSMRHCRIMFAIRRAGGRTRSFLTVFPKVWRVFQYFFSTLVCNLFRSIDWLLGFT